jgi:hypothetical protein
MQKSKPLFLVLFLLVSKLYCQKLIWTGTENSNFFNESNWLVEGSNTAPIPNTINPLTAVNRELIITNADFVNANGTINLGNGSISITSSNLEALAIQNGSLKINDGGYINLANEDALQNNVNIEINHPLAWLKLKKTNPQAILNNYLNQITVDGNNAIYNQNLRLDNYYTKGSIIRIDNDNTAALQVFEGTNLTGNSAHIYSGFIASENEIPNNLNNKIRSFILNKGFMATMAINADGTGLSQVYIASEEDLIMNNLPSSLLSDVSFIRVVPWNWVDKKGTGGDILGLDNSWYYRWNNQGDSDMERECTPMAWGKGAADSQEDIDKYIGKYKTTHVLAFNESDNCNDQSGQYGDLCNTDVAVATYENLMKTGLRLVSPSCRENAPFSWLKEFYNKATDQNIRIDIIGVHWYDWGSNPVNSPNESPQKVFNRFKNYLQNVYDLYGLPIWITEFNANPNRNTWVNKQFMELALPYLENLDYVERYAWFQPNSGVADYFENDNYTAVGEIYKNQISTPSIPNASLSSESNLNEAILTAEAVNQFNFVVYPNPVKNQLYIQSNSKIKSIEIYNLNGQLLLKSSKGYQNINTKGLNRGTYILKINDTFSKFIKL